MSGGDGMGSNTQVHVVSHAWALVATSCCARHLTSSFPVATTLWQFLPDNESPRVKRLGVRERRRSEWKW
jgi:hypothetical protein